MSSDMAAQFCRSCGLFLQLLFLLWGFFPWSSYGQTTPALYVFGDSLADVGNNNYLPLTLVKANLPPSGVDYPGGKPTGRYSNGKILPDFFADKLALQSPPPYLSLSSSATDVFFKGVNFASGGAGVLSTTLQGQCVPLDKQIEYFSTVKAALQQKLGNIEARNLLSRSVFLVVIGSNDLFGYLLPLSPYRLRFNLQQFVGNLIDKLRGQLKSLYDLGARRVVFIGTGPIGCVPGLRMLNSNKDCNAEANDGSQRFNAGVTSLLQEMKAALSDFRYSFSDTYGALSEILGSPSTNGFTEEKVACCGLRLFDKQLACLPFAPYCPDREAYVFWDLVHPTQAIYRKLTDKLFDASLPVFNP